MNDSPNYGTGPRDRGYSSQTPLNTMISNGGMQATAATIPVELDRQLEFLAAGDAAVHALEERLQLVLRPSVDKAMGSGVPPSPVHVLERISYNSLLLNELLRRVHDIIERVAL